MALIDSIGQLREQFLNELNQVSHTRDLETLKVKYFGKKGSVQALLMGLKDCTPAERPHAGKLVNDLKQELQDHFDNTTHRLKLEERKEQLLRETLDITLPGRVPPSAALHPITQMLDRILSIFADMGFSVRLGPDVDTEYYNFEGLNFPPDHPARDMQDTFYLDARYLLRTHTSNVQIHTLENYKPPIRVVAPGRCFRNEDISARSHVFFHQVEGFYIDEHVTFTDLFATFNHFLTRLFGTHAETRFRPSYFPFVEPGLEIDVRCTACAGTGCRICKQTGWLEIAGAGMIHPSILTRSNIDPDRYTGFAWGLGIERLAMLLSSIPDIRLFTQNDLRFLKQFP